jgi:hypothetical protein
MFSVRNKLYSRLFGEAEQLLHNGVRTGSLTEKLLMNSGEEGGLPRSEIKSVHFLLPIRMSTITNAFLARDVGMVLMDTGAETSASFVHNIVLAFLSYPEFLKKAQEEIDSVIGSSRLPVLEDYENLPYLKAFMEEVRYPASFPVSDAQFLM